MTDRPEELELVDRLLAVARDTHQYAFRVHRQLVELDAGNNRARTLLAQSAATVLYEIPNLTRDWRVLELEWFETELLDPANLDRKTQALTTGFAELHPQLQALLVRQDEIIAELVNLLKSARRT
jgi:hypothetical protein